MESKTPRTDAFARIIYGLTEFVEAKLARQLETELADKDKRLAEARAELERLKAEIRDNNYLAARQIVPAEMAVDDLRAEIERKDRLIEQMRVALVVADALVTNLIDVHVDKCASIYDDDRDIIKAALAAERIQIHDSHQQR